MSYAFPTSGFSAAQEFNALMYGESHPNTVSFIKNQFANYADTLTAAGRTFMEQGRNVVEALNSSEAMRYTREVINRYMGNTEVQRDGIYSIFEMSKFQSASLQMQRFLMANPVARTMYHKQLCNGYGDTYVDMEPGYVGEQHYDYRRVMDEMMIVTENDFHVTTYLDNLKDSDRDLMHDEKDDILYSWSNMNVLLALSGADPMSAEGSML